jgi:hypothetical protein
MVALIFIGVIAVLFLVIYLDDYIRFRLPRRTDHKEDDDDEAGEEGDTKGS